MTLNDNDPGQANRLDCPGYFRAMNQLLHLHTAPAYGIVRNEAEWRDFFALCDLLYGTPLATALAPYPLTKQDVKLCYLVRARLRNKAIGLLFNTTPNSVIKAKQRLKHKLGLLPEESLYEFVRRL